VHPVFRHLEELVSRGDVLCADDTGVKILDLVRDNRTKAEGERTGTYTTGIVSRVEGRQIALYRSGRRHAGENVGRLPAERPGGLPVPVQIGDALARNWSHSFTVVAKCLAHARRRFVEIVRAFPTACARVLDALQAWIGEQFRKRLVERNSSQGSALRYLLEHWAGAGCELDTLARFAIYRQTIYRSA
jgi:transposase